MRNILDDMVVGLCSNSTETLSNPHRNPATRTRAGLGCILPLELWRVGVKERGGEETRREKTRGGRDGVRRAVDTGKKRM